MMMIPNVEWQQQQQQQHHHQQHHQHQQHQQQNDALRYYQEFSKNIQQLTSPR
jgi:hypothetical protein